MQNSLSEPFLGSLRETVSNAYAMLVGLLSSVAGYFMPVRDIVHLLLLFFIADVAFGYWAARKLRKERFSVKIIWEHTMPRILVSIVLITGAFMWDKTYQADLFSTHKIIGWFISGVLLYSIAENGYQITKWAAFPILSNFIKSKTKERTGIDMDQQNQNNNETDRPAT